jgi:hypothetical protein
MPRIAKNESRQRPICIASTVDTSSSSLAGLRRWSETVRLADRLNP